MNKFFTFFTGAVLFLNLDLAFAAKDYCGAELFSNESVKYGRYDVRMRTISGSGTVSSFFLYYNDSYLGGAEPWREIDIEVLGKNNNVFQSNIITGNLDQKTTSEQLHNFSNLSNDYHTYSVEWTPDYIAWFFDGNQVRRTTGQQVTDCQSKDMSYRFNLWISDQPGWVGSFNPNILPVYQFINWMKYSKYTPGSGVNGTNFTPEWTDDFNTFDNSRWSKANYTFGGNLVDFKPSNIVVKDGYCVICLTKAGQTGFTGQVPVDPSTATINPKAITGMKTSPVRYPSLGESFLISLDGRLVSQKSIHSDKVNSGMWITRENNSIVQKTNLQK